MSPPWMLLLAATTHSLGCHRENITLNKHPYMDALVQDCSNSSALAMELLQSCTKPSLDGLVQDCSNSSVLALELLPSCTKLRYILSFSHTKITRFPARPPCLHLSQNSLVLLVAHKIFLHSQKAPYRSQFLQGLSLICVLLCRCFIQYHVIKEHFVTIFGCV